MSDSESKPVFVNRYDIPHLLTEGLIKAKLNTLADQISEYYKNKVSLDNPLVLLVILKGSVIFYSDLVRKLRLPVVTEFISISSYGNDKESSGQVRLELDTRDSIKGRHVLVIEDIIDTGNTLSVVMDMFKAREPTSLNIVTLLSKPSRREKEIDVQFIGFTIEDRFVVGYGLDYAERYRELPFIGVLE